ncbi:hypothetical protein DFH28DRAFT_863198, partial [Melampsora americana]
QCSEFLSQKKEGEDLKNQEWATEEMVLEVYHQYLNELGTGIKMILNRMRLWLEDEKIINVIFPSFQDELLISYQKFFNFCRFEFHELIKNQSIKSLEDFKLDLEKLVY